MQKQNRDHKQEPDFDCSSFPQLLNRVEDCQFPISSGMVEMDARARTKLEVKRLQLEHQAECANASSEVMPFTPAAISVPNSASVTQKPFSNHALGLVTNQHSSHNETRLPRVVMEAPYADSYNWRKYGQKPVKGCKNLRSYYRCVHCGCLAKKKVQHCDQSGRVVDVIYIGDHCHDPPKRKCVRVVSAAKPDVGSQILDGSAQKLEGSDISVCSADGRNSSLLVPDSEQQSSSSSNGNAGVKISERNGDEPESNRCFSSSAVGSQETGFCGLAGNVLQEKHVTEPGLKTRMKDRGVVDSAPVLKTKKEPEKVVLTVSDEGSSSDGYRWRKYGQKILKGNSLRSYYKCTSSACPARKHVERAADDASASTITYEGKHDHDKPVPKKRPGPENNPISPTASMQYTRCNKSRRFGLKPSSRCSADGEIDWMGEKILELGGEQALESAQALLSIGIEPRP